MFTNVFYQTGFSPIGGVETFLYELARLTSIHHRDFTIVYKYGDPEQIKRLKRYCRVIQLGSIAKPIKCKRAFFNYGTDAIDDIEAEEYYQVIHADFLSPSLVNYPPQTSEKINHYIAVSKNNARSYEAITGVRPRVINNPITIDDEPRILTLVSAQRITSEKGPTRLREMVNRLEASGIPYVWHIFSTGRIDGICTENVVYHTPNLNIRKWLKYADYTVLLSDTEGFPYILYESLCLGTPIVVTKLPMLAELPADDTNSIRVDFDLHDLDVKEIYDRAGTFKFKFEPRGVKEWLGLLQGKGDYVCPDVMIEVTKQFFDTVEGREMYPGTTYSTTPERADLIVGHGYAKRKGD